MFAKTLAVRDHVLGFGYNKGGYNKGGYNESRPSRATSKLNKKSSQSFDDLFI
jgi:hypothetical protein